MFEDEQKTKHLYAFERKIRELMLSNGVKPEVFFRRFPTMNTAMWILAHSSFGHSKTPEQGATDWFAECVQPKIDKLRKRAKQ
jgi:hypothetical protein